MYVSYIFYTSYRGYCIKRYSSLCITCICVSVYAMYYLTYISYINISFLYRRDIGWNVFSHISYCLYLCIINVFNMLCIIHSIHLTFISNISYMNISFLYRRYWMERMFATAVTAKTIRELKR